MPRLGLDTDKWSSDDAGDRDDGCMRAGGVGVGGRDGKAGVIDVGPGAEVNNRTTAAVARRVRAGTSVEDRVKGAGGMVDVEAVVEENRMLSVWAHLWL